MADEGGDLNITVVAKTGKEKKDVSVIGSGTVKELKMACALEFGATANQLCVIFAGRMMTDGDVMADWGIKEGSNVHLVIKSASRAMEEASERADQNAIAARSLPPADVSASPFGLGVVGGISGLGNLGMGSANFMDLQQRMMREMISNPAMLRNLLDSPFVRQMMENTELMRQLMDSNPQLREVMERNPEIVQTMADPDIMKRMTEVACSPAMLQELMRGQEHLLQHLVGPNVTFASASQSGTDSSHSTETAAAKTTAPTTAAEVFADPAVRSVMLQVAHDPHLMNTMMQAPYVQSMIQSLSDNPKLVEQMLTASPMFANNPTLQQLIPQTVPYFTQQLQNPEVQSLMMNPRAVQAMLLIQQGMNELQREAPTAFNNSSTVGVGGDEYTQFMSQMLNLVSSNQNTDLPADQRYALQLYQLSAMGFSNKEANLEALTMAQGDLNLAVVRLTQNF